MVAAGSTLVLARLLDREAFGVAAYAITFTSLLEVLRGLGIGQALIFFPRDERRTQTAFWLIAPTACCSGCWRCWRRRWSVSSSATRARPPSSVSWFFYFPLLALGQVLDVELRKDLRFGRRFGPELARATAKASDRDRRWPCWAPATGAWWWRTSSAPAVWSAALLMIVPWRPRWSFDRAEAKRLFAYGKHMVAASVLVAISLRADTS